jgi:hypothetical protein
LDGVDETWLAGVDEPWLAGVAETWLAGVDEPWLAGVAETWLAWGPAEVCIHIPQRKTITNAIRNIGMYFLDMRIPAEFLTKIMLCYCTGSVYLDRFLKTEPRRKQQLRRSQEVGVLRYSEGDRLVCDVSVRVENIQPAGFDVNTVSSDGIAVQQVGEKILVVPVAVVFGGQAKVMTASGKCMKIEKMPEHADIAAAGRSDMGLDVAHVGAAFGPEPFGDAGVDLRADVNHPVRCFKQLLVQQRLAAAEAVACAQAQGDIAKKGLHNIPLQQFCMYQSAPDLTLNLVVETSGIAPHRAKSTGRFPE